jgi:hypothetical protein
MRYPGRVEQVANESFQYPHLPFSDAQRRQYARIVCREFSRRCTAQSMGPRGLRSLLHNKSEKSREY